MKISTASTLQQFRAAQAQEQQTKQEINHLAEKTETNAKIKKLSQEYESIFVSMMFKQMDKAGFKSDLIDTGLSEDIYKDMYYNKIAKKAAFESELGIAESMYQQLKK
ncbi:rod-binding protein [Halanaerobacter jeridensis]|uniref:Flagellar protein FlgJ n=1 Tax=Halanaerobacter jeridensis TaxID=706427 RepID=A0A938XSP0_9FIRM|nr:rod-binding protein [Halanaerobacter jeridensis]MBM7556996.1 flagellar protein FlgJ [Halanaerobacter jeridensis]